MTWLGLIYFIFICYGITSIVVQSKIFKPLRETIKTKSYFFGSLLNCMMCFGFWVGLFVVPVLSFSPTAILFGKINLDLLQRIIFTIFDAAFISGIVYYINIIELYIESKLPNEQ
jgi:hypothetical protein